MPALNPDRMHGSRFFKQIRPNQLVTLMVLCNVAVMKAILPKQNKTRSPSISIGANVALRSSNKRAIYPDAYTTHTLMPLQRAPLGQDIGGYERLIRGSTLKGDQ
jgi:hypothetical protein